MPLVYTDIDPATGLRNKLQSGVAANADVETTMALFGSRVADITDGLSNTISTIEDAGRPANTPSPYDPAEFVTALGGASVPRTSGGVLGVDANQLCSGKSCENRWADPDSGSGVSGPPQNDPANAAFFAGGGWQILNNNRTSTYTSAPPGQCSWTVNNCGPNEEPFSFHIGGVHAAFADGSARFVSENVDWRVLRAWLTRSGGEPITE
jgi:hypothetical protein